MDNEYIPHQNLEDPDRIIANSKLVSNNIFANSADNFKPLNQTIKEQNDYLTNINNEIEKTTVIYLAEPLNDKITMQENEIESIKWCTFEETINILTFDNLQYNSNLVSYTI